METGRRFPMDAKVLGPILKAHTMSVCGGWFSGLLLDGDMETEKQRIAPQMALFKAVNAPCIVYGECARTIQGDRSKPLATKPKLSEDEIKVYARKMTKFGEWCAEQGMPLSYHHHMAAVIETEPELDMFMKHSGVKASRCFSMPATWRLRAAMSCASSTSTTSALRMFTPRMCAWM